MGALTLAALRCWVEMRYPKVSVASSVSLWTNNTAASSVLVVSFVHKETTTNLCCCLIIILWFSDLHLSHTTHINLLLKNTSYHLFIIFSIVTHSIDEEIKSSEAQMSAGAATFKTNMRSHINLSIKFWNENFIGK